MRATEEKYRHSDYEVASATEAALQCVHFNVVIYGCYDMISYTCVLIIKDSLVILYRRFGGYYT